MQTIDREELTAYRIDDVKLDLAIAIWEEGHDIPFVLECDLLASGYDVATLREKYMA